MKKHMSDIRKDVLPALLCTLSLGTLATFGTVHANAQTKANPIKAQKITRVSPIQKKSNESLNHGNINIKNNKVQNNLKAQNGIQKVNKPVTPQVNKNNQNKQRVTFSVKSPHHYHFNKSNIRVRNFKFSGTGLQRARKTELKLGFRKAHHIKRQHRHQREMKLITPKPKVRKHFTKATPISRRASEHSDKVNDYIHAKWFVDGLSKKEQHARNWIITHESGWHWRILSYGGRCIGLFQLDPAYLKKHGHIDLQHHHQVKVADKYVKGRYHTWKRAKAHWEALHWY